MRKKGFLEKLFGKEQMIDIFNQNKKSTTEKDIDGDAYKDALDWEASKQALLLHSEQKAWRIAMGAAFIAVLSWIAIVLMLPLKESVPYLVRVDNTTGVPDIITTLKNKSVTEDEVINKYWLGEYVRARETYDWYTLQKDYEKVGLLSSKPVGKSYAELFNGQEALDKRYGGAVRATVHILSVVPTSTHTGTVRFIKTIKRVDEEGRGAISKWVATVSFEYKNPSQMKESERLINPLGFQVMSYRVDPEMLGDDK